MHSFVRNPAVLPGVDVISIRSDRSFPRHSHDEFGIGYLVSGGQESWSGRGLVEAGAGDIITVNPGEMHDGIGRAGKPRHWRMLFLAPEALPRYAERRADDLVFENPVMRTPAQRGLVEGAIAAIAEARPDATDIEERVMLAVRDVFDGGDGEPFDTATDYSSGVRRVLERMHDAFSEPLSLSDYAETSGLSRFQILRRFTKEVGATPHAYLTQYRVKQAKQWMSGGMPVAEAAVSSGFSDQSHLTRAFQRQIGVTPGRFLAARAG